MMSRFSKIFIRLGLLLFLILGGTAVVQAKTPSSGFLSLSEAIQIAITHNPSINEVQAQVDISKERIV
ncbi:MAG: hypothetical protein JRE65_15670 [Deltaproteobacteria bacterium]|jgi:hypothetical protein|nr:hypothetical protein [Deltaproteobacteria bacterium]